MNPPIDYEAKLDALETPKPWWESLGIKGSLGTAAGSLAVLCVAIAKFLGYEIDLSATELLIGSIFGLITAVATWRGRVRADQPISTRQVLPGLTLSGEDK